MAKEILLVGDNPVVRFARRARGARGRREAHPPLHRVGADEEQACPVFAGLAERPLVSLGK